MAWASTARRDTNHMNTGLEKTLVSETLQMNEPAWHIASDPESRHAYVVVQLEQDHANQCTRILRRALGASENTSEHWVCSFGTARALAYLLRILNVGWNTGHFNADA